MLVYFLILFIFLFIIGLPLLLLPSLKKSVSVFFKNLSLTVSYSLFSKTDFLLQISPNKSCLFSSYNKNKPNFPPPGYGVPPDKKNTLKEKSNEEYSMRLVLGRLRTWFFAMVFGLTLIATAPMVYIFPFEHGYIRLLIIFFIIGSSLGLYKLVYLHMERPILSDIWVIWPEPCYHMLRSVPHRIYLSQKDQKRSKRSKRHSIYWNPKPQMPLHRQPREYAANIPTLQSVLLNFALFDMFFHKKRSQAGNSNILSILNIRNWATYWMAPIWGSYLFLIISMVINFIAIKYQGNSVDSASNHFWLNGGSFVIAIILWMFLTAAYIHYHFAKLVALKDKISSGYFKRHEELVPQQVLERLTDIPEEKQIANIIDKLRIFFNFLLFGAFVNFLLVLDALK